MFVMPPCKFMDIAAMIINLLCTAQGSSDGSDLTVHGEAQAARCREAISHMQFDRYIQLGCANLSYLQAGS